MNYLTLDTNAWIYLANGIEPVKLLKYILDEVSSGNITLILPDIILLEWEKNKEQAVKVGTLANYNRIIDSLERYSRLIGDIDEKNILKFLFEEEAAIDSEDFNEIFKKIKQQKRNIETAIQENIEKIDQLFQNPNVIKLQTTNRLKLWAAEHAFNKKAPFLKKNSFADALIIFNFLEYVKNFNIKGAIFVTYNIEDFCLKANRKKILHPDLQEYFNEKDSKFFTILGEALKTIKEDIVSKETIEFIREQQDEYANDEYDTCKVCDGNEGFGNEINFTNPYVITNYKFKNVVPSEQLEFDFVKSMPKTTRDNLSTKVQSGECQNCGTLHIKCQECGEITAIEEFNAKIYCEGCGLPYFVDTTYNHGDYEIKILDNRLKICSKCGSDYSESDCDLKICDECREQYI